MFKRVAQPTARSLILDLLSALPKGSMPARALIEAGSLFGLEENNIRVALTRLNATQRIERDERGRYSLGPAAAAISRQLRTWRNLHQQQRSWQGDWLALQSPRLGQGSVRRQRERALNVMGFRALEPGFALRPDNLNGGPEAAREQLFALFSDSGNAHGQERLGRFFVICQLDPASDREARALWDTQRLTHECEQAISNLDESSRKLKGLTLEEAMVESFLVGGQVLDLLLRHPLLPAEILDPRPLHDLVEAMRCYDQTGRSAWTPFLDRHDVPHRALPLHVGRWNALPGMQPN
jgi:phenylacetic acid degradation operon negative regulatory protein